MKLAMLALLIHPIMILGPTGLAGRLDWGTKSVNNPAAHGLSEILYEFSSASANNGSEFGGLEHRLRPQRQQGSRPIQKLAGKCRHGPGHVDLAVRADHLSGRARPSASRSRKPTPFTAGTLRTDTFTFAFVLVGTILLVGRCCSR